MPDREAFGRQWVVWADRAKVVGEDVHEKEWCIGAELGDRAAITCEPKLEETVWASPEGNSESLIVGSAAEHVARVVYEMSDGRRIEGRVIETPEELDAPFDAFVLLFEGIEAGGTIIAFDESGAEVDRLSWPSGSSVT
jgi:hypothetical protein